MAIPEETKANIETINKIVSENAEALGENAEVFKTAINSTIKALKNSVDAEKRAGVKATKELHSKTNGLNDVITTIQDATGWTEEKGSLFEYLNSYTATKVDGGDNKDQGDDTPTKKTNPEDIEIRRKFQKAEKERKSWEAKYKAIEEEKKQIAEEKNQMVKANEKKRIESCLQKAFRDDTGKETHYGVEDKIYRLLGENKLYIDEATDKVVWKTDDIDLPQSFDEGFESYVSSAMIQRTKRDSQKAGAGSGGANINKFI